MSGRVALASFALGSPRRLARVLVKNQCLRTPVIRLCINDPAGKRWPHHLLADPRAEVGSGAEIVSDGAADYDPVRTQPRKEGA